MAPPSFKVNIEYAKMSEVIPGLFICGVSSLTKENMCKHKITLIINATYEVPNFKMLGNITRQKLWIEDTADTDIFPMLDCLCDQVHVNIVDGGHVLIHCVAGVSRSATICLAYLTKYHCRSLRDAYNLMALKRPMVRPILNFWRALIQYEQIVKGRSSSVRLINDESQPDKYLPDVYLKLAIPAREESAECYENLTNDGLQLDHLRGRNKFEPMLEPLSEVSEVALESPASNPDK